jgi:hypothetical protein
MKQFEDIPLEGMASDLSPTYLKLRGTKLVYAIVFCCSIGFLLFGYDLGFMGGLTTDPDFLYNLAGNVSNSLHTALEPLVCRRANVTFLAAKCISPRLPRLGL